MTEKLFSIIAVCYRMIFARPACFKFNKLLLELSMRGLGVKNAENDEASGEISFLTNMLKRYDRPVVLDVGANRGNYAKKIMSLAPGATLFAFEPHPATFAILAQNAEKYGFEAINCGMGADAGILQLFDRLEAEGSGSEHASVYRDVIEGVHHVSATAVEVRLSTVDAFVSERALESITLLKIDTEGHEYQVLQGAAETLARGVVELIQIEFNEMNTISRVFFRDFYRLLGDRYNVYRLLPGGLLPITTYRPLLCEIFAYQNLLFIRRDSSMAAAGVL
ncbi:MAG: FkbM family methyltransferase [Desulfuromonadaceae bacterium]|nr:FkbM family methyltransferase [Desulfuromonadaceae bacterium]